MKALSFLSIQGQTLPNKSSLYNNENKQGDWRCFEMQRLSV